jgi:hypothetical protein
MLGIALGVATIALLGTGRAEGADLRKICQIMPAPDRKAASVSLNIESATKRCDVRSLVEDLRRQNGLKKDQFETTAEFKTRASKALVALSEKYPANILDEFAVVLPVQPNVLSYDADKQEFYYQASTALTGRHILFDRVLGLKTEYSGSGDDGGFLEYVETDRETKVSDYDGETALGAKMHVSREEGTIWGVRVRSPWNDDVRALTNEDPLVVLPVPQSQARDAASQIYIVLIGKSSTSALANTVDYQQPTLIEPREKSFDIYLLEFSADDVWIVRADTGEILAKYIAIKQPDRGRRGSRNHPQRARP